ncbi:glutathione S-transferase U19 isoform X2 [Selaginella moellendorffii]|uniref:glutathione S-transferase U19 isoform X2 n=1 Tax=Selaginella moellendorffii TaxID=88036 RepID=UPI000D1CE9CC|nr:glutathione S-transferase U19 isoform X2 [Selaginella moellendorffii]|eukprot:XP_024540582.1 glutathione S-transferase U19 isoform X2 [Selaginella moellendorffii]
MASHGQDVTLLTVWASPFSMRAKLALLLKGIEHEDLPQDLGNKSKLLLESNPVHKKIPVLIHKGKPVPESVIIVQYIDEVWPETSPLLPQDAFLRAKHRFWTDFIDKKIFDSLARFMRSSDGGAAVNEEFIQNCMLLEGALAELGSEEDGPFFGGASMSFLDVMLAPYSVLIPGVEQVMGLKPASPEQCPRLHKLFGAVAEHPSAKAALPQIEKLKEFIQARFARK